MSNTKNILLIAAITSLLVMGTSITPMQSFADRDDDDDEKTNDNNSQKDKNDANLHLDQDNTCYRSDGCQQANEGQQIVGEDNKATGFNDQSDNISPSSSSDAGPAVTPSSSSDAGPAVTPSSSSDAGPAVASPDNGACDNGQVGVTGNIGAGIQINGCISSSLVGLLQSLPTLAGASCEGSLVDASLTIGNNPPTTVCVPPSLHA
jgi:hypothetical protein